MKHTKLINDLILLSGQISDLLPDEAEAMREAADAIRELQENLPKWIPAAEQIPKPYERVIVAREFEPGKPLKVEQGMLTEGGWWKVYGTNVKRISYWMPLPEPPKEGE